MTSSLSHIAVLVPSVLRAAEYLSKFEFEIGEVEDFSETKEIYIQGRANNPLLLMEAKETGSYRKALEKRGPGFHHIAIDVLDLDSYLSSLSTSGWLLHLNSLNSIKKLKTAYLARPGFPALIEVHEKKELSNGPLFVESVSLKYDPKFQSLVSATGLSEFVKRCDGYPSLTVSGRTISMQDLF